MKKLALLFFSVLALWATSYSQNTLCDNVIKKITPEMESYFKNIRSENGIGGKIKIYKSTVKYAGFEDKNTVIGKEGNKWTLNIDLLEHATYEEAKSSFENYKTIVKDCALQDWEVLQEESTERFIRHSFYLKHKTKSNLFIELIVSGINDINKVTITFKSIEG